MRSLAALAALGTALVAGCDHVPKDALRSCNAEVRVLPARTDILVVVDDSGSMTEEQQNLRENLASFVTALAASPVPHDFQIGVTTTDVLDFDGRTTTYPTDVPPYAGLGYPIPYPKGALVAVDPGARTDPALVGKILYDPATGFGGPRILPTGSPTLVQDFEANVLLGVEGSGKEQPFHAVELALTDRIADGTNAGFLRDGARLGVVILTDEDDCSESTLPLAGYSNPRCHDPTVKAERLWQVSAFADFLDGPIAGEARAPVLAVIAGFDPSTLAPTGCATSYDTPDRLAELLDLLGPDRTLRASVCDPSFGPALQRVADLLVPQTVPLDGAPPDWHMLVAAVHRADGTAQACPVAGEGDPSASAAGAVYGPPRSGRPPTLTFQGSCRLHGGDSVSLGVICAG
ncbi:MAG TPA: hypothetical protein VFG59_16920 [Anaeromyxobacter sp.]|nr:hypothetical protein [Anaeromyxobacter sp.]